MHLLYTHIKRDDLQTTVVSAAVAVMASNVDNNFNKDGFLSSL